MSGGKNLEIIKDLETEEGFDIYGYSYKRTLSYRCEFLNLENRNIPDAFKPFSSQKSDTSQQQQRNIGIISQEGFGHVTQD